MSRVSPTRLSLSMASSPTKARHAHEDRHAPVRECEHALATDSEGVANTKASASVTRPLPPAGRTAPHPLGLFAGEVRLHHGFDDPLPEKMVQAFEALS